MPKVGHVRDPRLDEYARLLVERSVKVQPGWQVVIRATPLARPLIEAIAEQVARRGAYPLLLLSFEQIGGPFAREAPLDVLRVPAPLQKRVWEEMDALIAIWAPESIDEGSDLSEARREALQQSSAPMRERTMAMSVPWVIAEYAVPAPAEAAGMTLAEYEQFIFDAVLRDWDAEAARMRAIATSSTRPRRCGSSAPAPISTLSLAGRTGAVDDGHVNMPGGEVFYSPPRGLGERRDRVRRVPGRLLRPRGRARATRLRGRPRRRRVSPRAARSSCCRRSTSTREPGASASSASAAIRASSAS